MDGMDLYLSEALKDSEGLPEKLHGLGTILSRIDELKGLGLFLEDCADVAKDLRGRIAFAQEKLAESTEGNQ